MIIELNYSQKCNGNHHILFAYSFYLLVLFIVLFNQLCLNALFVCENTVYFAYAISFDIIEVGHLFNAYVICIIFTNMYFFCIIRRKS